MSLKHSAMFCHYSALEFLCITTASNFQSFKCYCTDPVISHDPTLITWQKDHGAQSLTGLKTFVFMSMMPSRNVDSDADQEWGYFFFWPSDLAKAQFFNIEHWNRNFHQLCNYNQGISCNSHNSSCLAQNLTFPALTLKTSTDLSLRSQQKKKKWHGAKKTMGKINETEMKRYNQLIYLYPNSSRKKGGGERAQIKIRNEKEVESEIWKILKEYFK